MSRSGYTNDCDSDWACICYRGAVNASIKGKRGQKLLRALLQALDEMPNKRLISGEFEIEGDYCALGTLGAKLGMPIKDFDPEDYDEISRVFDIAPSLAREIMDENDNNAWQPTPEQRWVRMRAWVNNQIAREEGL